MEFINSLPDFPISTEAATKYLYVSLTLLIAVLVDNLLRSSVKVPHMFDNSRAQTFITVVKSSITILVYIVTLHIIFIQLGIDITPLLASAGIIGVILGIGARPIIEDVITGFFLVSQQRIAINDYVKIDDAEGYIDSIGLRTLSIRTLSGATYIVPNGQIKKLLNFSRNISRLMLNIPVKADQPVDKVLDAFEKALKQMEHDSVAAPSLLPGSKVNGVEDFLPNGTLTMIIQVVIVTDPAKRWDVGQRYRYLLKKEFEKHKLNLA